MKSIIIIGYSGHAYVVCDVLLNQGKLIYGYCDIKEQESNPFNLLYLGSEEAVENQALFQQKGWIVGIGDNHIRKKVTHKILKSVDLQPSTAVHRSVAIGTGVIIGAGSLLAPQVSVNALAKIGDGVICNTGSIIEHECQIDDFVHIAPGAVLAGSVSVGASSFIGANTVVKQGVNIGANVIVGAGTVIINDIPDNVTVVGNPGRIIQSNA